MDVKPGIVYPKLVVVSDSTFFVELTDPITSKFAMANGRQMSMWKVGQ